MIGPYPSTTDVLSLHRSSGPACLALARRAIEELLSCPADPSPSLLPASENHEGVFVTIHVAGKLRGCIGFLNADLPLSESLMLAARSAASKDCRFDAIRHQDLPELTVEVTLLGPREKILGPDDVEIGRHGLFLEGPGVRGILLPQVATEYQVTASGFLDMLCRKAGASRNYWAHPDARVSRFEALIFSDPPRIPGA